MKHLLPILPNRRKAFTLIEVLVASVILVIIIGSMTIIFLQANKAWSETEARLQVYQNSREALNSISRDIACAYQSTSTLAKLNYDGATLYFTAAVNTSYGVNEYDLSIVGYKLDSATNIVEKYKEDYDGTQDDPWVVDLSCWNPLAENITALSFEFYDHMAATPAWVNVWDSSVGVNDYLPQAVRITINAQDKQARFSKEFKTTVYIPTY